MSILCPICSKQPGTVNMNTLWICKSCYVESVQLLVMYDEKRSPENSHVIHIDGHLYISDQDAARNKVHLNQVGIQKILIAGSYLQPWFENDFEYKQLPWEDSYKQNITNHLEDALQFIHTSNEKTLVHCAAGISRSGSVIVAYFMKTYGLCYDDALQKARSKSPRICPNQNFERQLRNWEKTLK